MKQRKQLLAIVLLLSIACATQNANQAAYVSVGALVNGVDLAMRTWAAYVVKVGPCPSATGPCVSKEQEAWVRQAHDRYRQTAANLAIVVQASNQNPTPQEFADAANAVISIVETFTGKKISR